MSSTPRPDQHPDSLYVVMQWPPDTEVPYPTPVLLPFVDRRRALAAFGSKERAQQEFKKYGLALPRPNEKVKALPVFNTEESAKRFLNATNKKGAPIFRGIVKEVTMAQLVRIMELLLEHDKAQLFSFEPEPFDLWDAPGKARDNYGMLAPLPVVLEWLKEEAET